MRASWARPSQGRLALLLVLLVDAPTFATHAQAQTALTTVMTPLRNEANDRDPNAYSEGLTLRDRALILHDEHPFTSVWINQLEALRGGDGDSERSVAFEGQVRHGTAFDRWVIKAEGESTPNKTPTTATVQTAFLWSHAIASFWDAQLGIGFEHSALTHRPSLAWGVQGLAPYWFEVNATAYLGYDGQTTLKFDADYDLLLTQRLILQPRAQWRLYGQDDAPNGRGRGLASGVLGMRLRYEFSRQFAPYLGVEHTNLFAQTAQMARNNGAPTAETRWIAGLRFWF